MRKKEKTAGILSLLLAIVLLLSGCNPADRENISQMIDRTASSIQKLGEGGSILKGRELLPAGDSASDWIAMTLALSGRKDDYEAYLESLEEYVIEKYRTEGVLHSVKATEYHRIALTMLALGGNPARIMSGEEEIDLIADGTYRFQGGNPGLQGANGLCYALLVLNALVYEIPKEEAFDSMRLVKELLDYQNPEGGFSLDKSLGSDIDITAMALQALAPYGEKPEVKEAIEAALFWLSEKMTEEGTFISYGSENAESCAQVILALCALKIDPEESEQFQKQQNVLQGLNSFRLKDGGYQHIKEEQQSNLMATYQALLALEAVERLRTEGQWIFDFKQ
ncbi:MAG: terpene cyclase/mutase family protein [Lachnospiraceae bacterium]|nr:terpene cyclase/mutase family protein [Lachnospiraceae bacterium]